MAVFAYRGRNARGDLVQGTLEGVDSGAVADQLFNTGIVPTEINAARADARPAVKGAGGWWPRLRICTRSRTLTSASICTAPPG